MTLPIVAADAEDGTSESTNDIEISEEDSVAPLTDVSRCVAFVLMLGALWNVWSGYEWLPFRVTDLYGEAPSSSDYRAFRGTGLFLLPTDYSMEENVVERLEALPGVQVLDDVQSGELQERVKMAQRREVADSANYTSDHGDDPLLRELLSKLVIYRQYSNRTERSSLPLSVRRLGVIVDIDDEDETTWMEWLTKPYNSRLAIYVHPGRRSIPPRNYLHKERLIPTTYQRSYPRSVLFWMVMTIPVLLLLFHGPASRALFTITLSPGWMNVKQFIIDPLSIILCLVHAKNKGYSPIGLYFQIVGIAAVDLVAGIMHKKQFRSDHNEFGKFVGKGCLSVSLLCKGMTVLAITYSTWQYETRNDKRQSSFFWVILAHMLCANLFTEFLLVLFGRRQSSKRWEGAKRDVFLLNRTQILSGLSKLALSIMFFSAGATKLGESGMRWIDDRFLARLSLRGRYSPVTGSLPFPLEWLVLAVPCVFRAAGMGLILMLELASLGSWWFFGIFMSLYAAFTAGATISVGVPYDKTLLPMLDKMRRSYGSRACMLAAGIIFAALLFVLRRTRAVGASRKRKHS